MGKEMEEIKMVECENAGFTSPHEQIKDTSMALKHVKYHVLNELPGTCRRCSIGNALEARRQSKWPGIKRIGGVCL